MQRVRVQNRVEPRLQKSTPLLSSMLTAAVFALLASTSPARAADDNKEQLGYSPKTKHPVVDQVGGTAWQPEGDGWRELLDGAAPPDPNTWDAQATVDGRDLALRQPSLVTNATDAKVHYQFYGSRIKLLGKFHVPGGLVASDGHWDLLLDGVSILQSNCNVSAQNDAPSTLWCGEFPEQHHVLTVETGPNWLGELTLWNATATHVVMSQGDLDWSPKVYAGTAGNRLSFAQDAKPNEAYKWTGETTVEPYAFKSQIESVVLKGDAQAELTLPPNVSSYQLRGHVGPGYGTVFAHFEPAPPSVADTLNRSTDRPWIMETMLLHTPLDPTQIYTVRVSSEAATAGQGVHLNSTTVTPWWINTTNWFSDDRQILWANGSSTDPTILPPAAGVKRVNAGAIAGGVIGGVVGVALIAALVYFMMRRRRKRPAKVEQRSRDHFVVDDDETVSPYGTGSEHHTTPPRTSESGAGGMAERPMLQLPPLTHSGKHQQLPRLTMPGAAPPPVSNPPSLVAATKAGWYEGGDHSAAAPLSAAPLSAAPLSAAPRLPLPGEMPHEPVFRQELDGGAVPQQDEVLVPPVYDPQWATANERGGAVPLSPAGYSPTTYTAGHSPGGYSATTAQSPSSDQHTHSMVHAAARTGTTAAPPPDGSPQDPFKTPATTPQHHVAPDRYELPSPPEAQSRGEPQRRASRPLPALPDRRT